MYLLPGSVVGSPFADGISALSAVTKGLRVLCENKIKNLEPHDVPRFETHLTLGNYTHYY